MTEKDLLEKAAKVCDQFVEAYSFYRPYPEGYVYSEAESRAAMHFAEGRFKVAAEKIRALVVERPICRHCKRQLWHNDAGYFTDLGLFCYQNFREKNQHEPEGE